MGAGLSMGLVLLFSKTQAGHQQHTMLLAGVAISFFFSSLLLLIQAASSIYQSYQIIRWLMGGISVVGYRELLWLTPILLMGFVVVFQKANHLNLLLLGDDLAQSRGLNALKTKSILILTVSLMVAAIVSVTGPIGFVGMVVPHICRIWWGGDHRLLMPSSLLLGGATLVGCDVLSRFILRPTGIPVGVITSLLGAPFFFFLLWTRRFRF